MDIKTMAHKKGYVTIMTYKDIDVTLISFDRFKNVKKGIQSFAIQLSSGEFNAMSRIFNSSEIAKLKSEIALLKSENKKLLKFVP